MSKKLLIIGGSPCSGKSTVASGIPCKVNDGSESVEQLYQWAKEVLGLRFLL